MRAVEWWGVAFVGVAGLTVATCQSRDLVGRDKTGRLELAGQGGAGMVLDARATPGSSANILVVPHASRGGKAFTLEFCFDGTNQYDPQIQRVRVARIGEPRSVCEIAAVGDAWLWKEWVVGSIPPGFRIVECAPLLPGQYEVYADGFVGDGVARLTLDQHGSIERMHWDNRTKSPLQECPRLDRKVPNTLPHFDAGVEGVLEKRRREIRERRSGN